MITSIAQPAHKYVTGYNPVVFAVDSTNKNATGFRYLFDIYSAGTSTLLGAMRVVPRINDGYGIANLDKLLQNYLTYDFSASTIPNSWVSFDLKVGESYGSDWQYDNYLEYSATGQKYDGFTILTGTTGHTYVIGEQINIVQDDEPTSNFPELSGLHTVVLVPNSTSIIVDVIFNANTGSTTGGTTTYADNARVNYRDLLNYSGYTAINGAVPFVTKFFNADDYVLSATSTTNLFVTTAPNNLSKTTYEDMFFNIINNYQNDSYYLYIQNSNGDVFRQTIVDSTEPMLQVPVGPNTITGATVSGTQPIVKSDTSYYDIWIATSGATQMTEKKRILIDSRCSIDYDGDYASICFLDRLGSFGSFAMQLKFQDNKQIQREIYNRQDGFINNGSWDYSLIENGTNIYNVDVTQNLVLNTNWMTEDESRYFDELYTSPLTLIKFNGNDYQRCDVSDNGFETSYQRNKRLIRKTVSVVISNKDNINI